MKYIDWIKTASSKLKMTTVFLILLIYSCDTTEPDQKPKIILQLEDAISTEAWLKLKTENINLPSEIELIRNGELVNKFTLNAPDTTLYETGLLLAQTNTYKARIAEVALSETITFETMDTTSHNFVWETFTFGEHSSSVLYDVAIIDENNIWAVGEIYLNDSTGQIDPYVYNAAHWDGSTWEIIRVSTNFRGNLIIVPLEGITTFSSSDIWLVGSLPIYGDGKNWKMFDLRTEIDQNLSLSRSWGSSSEDIYFVGRKGNIVHYNGSNWSKIESNTELNIQDIHGSFNSSTGKCEIIAVASEPFENNGASLIRINGLNAVQLSPS
jgi:hypothetical protein